MRTRHLLRLSLLTLAAACVDRDTMLTDPAASLAAVRASAERADAWPGASTGAVFTETNDVAENAVLAFDRAADGTLTFAGSFPTGGRGIGGSTDPLTSQYAVVLSGDHRFLYVANAGSDDISVFRVGGARRLALIQTIASGGVRPTSLALSRTSLYALNAASGTITGFALREGRLRAEPSRTRPLSAGASGAAEVRFSRDGRILAVSERLSATIDTYLVRPDGSLSDAIRNVSAGAAPFGFDFTARGRLVVSEAGPGTASSYVVSSTGALQVRTASASTLQRAPCWLVVTPDGRFAYTANAGSATITGFAVTNDGDLSLLASTGISADLGAGATPLDLDTTDDGRFLYVLEAGTGAIGMLAIHAGGALEVLGAVPAVAPRSGQMGIAAY